MIPMLPRGARGNARRRADYRPPAFLVDEIALTFDLDPDAPSGLACYQRGMQRDVQC